MLTVQILSATVDTLYQIYLFSVNKPEVEGFLNIFLKKNYGKGENTSSHHFGLEIKCFLSCCGHFHGFVVYKGFFILFYIETHFDASTADSF